MRCSYEKLDHKVVKDIVQMVLFERGRGICLDRIQPVMLTENELSEYRGEEILQTAKGIQDKSISHFPRPFLAMHNPDRDP